MKVKPHYRAVFISDTHLGFSQANPKALLAFLKSFECDYLYWVGDTFDFWSFRWNQTCSNVIARIIKMMKHGTKLFITPGNHDAALREFAPCELGDLSVADEFIHTTISGKRYLLFHGDIFDPFATWLMMLGNILYSWALVLNKWIHRIRFKLGFQTYWSFANYLKSSAKQAGTYIQNFETLALDYGKKKGCDGVICGHIHKAAIYKSNGIEYVNCGDWVESLTAIVENDKGELEIIHYKEMQEIS
jgi:UDP-2,3-diacylglucosamine pyrophosphatase LpxH